MTTGEKIRARRKALGMSVIELANRVGKNPATIYRYEGNAIEMPASMLKPLADALDTAPDELMDWDIFLREVTEHDKRMNQALALVDDGISTGGGPTYRYLLFKTLTYGGLLEFDFKSLLSQLHRIYAPEFDREIHAIRVLAELASCLDARSLENLISYGEYLVSQLQKKSGETFELPYQLEQSYSMSLEPELD